MWKSVVLIRVPTGPGGDPHCYNYGTGFVFLSLGEQKQVMTNYHVVKNHDSSIAPLCVIFFYNNDGGVPVTCEVTGDPVYYSLNGKKGRGVDETHLDFAVLNVEDIPDEAIGIPVDNPHANVATGTSPDVRTPALHTSVFIHSYSQGIIVGHPEGCGKHISTVKFQVTDFPVLKHKYSQKRYLPGQLWFTCSD